MTREEAIFELRYISSEMPSMECANWIKAISMAIKALEQEPVFFPPCQDCNAKMDEIRGAYDKLQEKESCDAVSRKAAIDVCLKGLNRKEMVANIKALPPVTPAEKQEPCDDEYIKVPKKALKYVTKGMVAYNHEWLKNHFDIERAVICGEQEPCDNCVSRQEVLDLIVANHTELNGVNVVMYSPLCKDIKQLPSVTSQQKVGHWVKTIGENGVTSAVRCSECGFEDNRYMLFRYCPNCSAKMQEVEE